MDPETRESLIARLPDHADSAAWHEFTELYEPLIYGIGRRHGLQPNDASDLVQEVFTAVATSIERFEPNQGLGRFRSWLFRVARNHALMQIRKLGRLPTAQSDMHQVLSAESAGSDHEFDIAFRRRAFRWAARRVRDSVKPTTWESFARTAINGELAQDVAADMGIDVGAVYLARSRVMSRLRKMVENVSAEMTAFDGEETSQEVSA